MGTEEERVRLKTKHRGLNTLLHVHLGDFYNQEIDEIDVKELPRIAGDLERVILEGAGMSTGLITRLRRAVEKRMRA